MADGKLDLPHDLLSTKTVVDQHPSGKDHGFLHCFVRSWFPSMNLSDMEFSQHDPNLKLSRPGEPEFELYTIPSHSSWFRWEDIHETEHIVLKEFFDWSSISRTPKIYTEYRDFIVNKYREEPSKRLTFTQSLVNFGAASDDSKNLLEDKKLKNQIRVEEGAPIGVRAFAMPNSLKPITIPPSGVDGRAVMGETGVKLPPLASYSDIFVGLVELKGLKCANCGEQCNSGCYEYRKVFLLLGDNYIICLKCFKNGYYGENKSMDNFKYNDCTGKGITHGAAWTEPETLLLLESVMKHGDDWELVAQNVKTKNKLDCISKLIELPFGEFMMCSAHRGSATGPAGSMNSAKQGLSVSSEHQEITKAKDQNGDAANQEPPAKRKRPASLSDAGSSLVKQVSHISTLVGPHITAVAADSAVTALCDEISCPIEIFDGDYNCLTDGSWSPTMLYESERAHQIDASEMKEKPSESATATALGSAAANAKLSADQEDMEIEHLVAAIIETQLQKLHRKIKHFDDLELIIDKEYAEMLDLKECIVEQRIDVLQKAFIAGVSEWRDQTYIKP
ncbi:hypothetical protein EZV62_022438 [Acer yangbiense]|uniref:Myb-like domain-containing protein n=1 Tax=Acer yangbiense TaxID=1000413 RepID=A0A5C7H942_9ROSI|nr:hypothetical protein EZV62_022438 [Acer yangbiense]